MIKAMYVDQMYETKAADVRTEAVDARTICGIAIIRVHTTYEIEIIYTRAFSCQGRSDISLCMYHS